MRENLISAAKNRLLQGLARHSPGATSVRVLLHRLRGVRIGTGVFIGTDVLIETSQPHLVWIGNNVIVSIRSVIIAHFEPHDASGFTPGGDGPTVRIDDDAFVGPGVIVLPNVHIGRGSVVAAGSVVTRSVPPHVMVQGNPARPVARCDRPLTKSQTMWQFASQVRRSGSLADAQSSGDEPEGSPS
jgi:acetyltransferase-like isoleucine patch superfamily enzyme